MKSNYTAINFGRYVYFVVLIIKIMEWLRLEATLKITQSQPPAVGRDTFL